MSGRGKKGNGKRRGPQKRGNDEAIISDPRFAHVHRDPRFQRMRKAKTQMVVDERFQRMFTDKEFNDLGGGGLVDKRGKPVRRNAGAQELRRLYRQGGEEEKEQGGKRRPEDIDVEAKAAATAKADITMNAKLARLNALARGELAFDGSSSSSDSSDSSDEDDVDLAAEDPVLALPEAARLPAARTTQAGQETARLAAVTMDWEHVRAVDIFAALQSFAPASGRIVSVKVIPSEYGRQRMAEEEKFGPKGLWKGSGGGGGGGNGEGSSSEEEEIELGSKRRGRTWREGGYDKARLRQYELNKMKYYFAVIECDSPATANALYTQCDGMEYERTSNEFDLQFIPDDVTFSTTPRDTATSVPKSYEPNVVMAPLQSTMLEPTWDQPDTIRVQKLRWEQQPGAPLDEDMFKAYLASSDSDSDGSSIIDPDASDSDDEQGSRKKKPRKLSKKQQRVRNKYKSLLEGLTEFSDDDNNGEASDGDGSDGEDALLARSSDTKTKASKKASGLDFTAGQDLLERMKTKRERANETVFEAEQRKIKEKRKAKRAAARQAREDAWMTGGSEVASAPAVEHDPFFETEPSKPAGGGASKRGRGRHEEREAAKAARRAKREAEARERAELELLMMDSNAKTAQGFDKRAIVKAAKASKSKRGKKRRRAAAAGDDFHPDVSDPRFSAVFEDSRFAIDPTHPQFKDTREMREILAERQQRRAKAKKSLPASRQGAAGAGTATVVEEVTGLVASLKQRLPKKRRVDGPKEGGVAKPAAEAQEATKKKKKKKKKKNKGKKSKAVKGGTPNEETSMEATAGTSEVKQTKKTPKKKKSKK